MLKAVPPPEQLTRQELIYCAAGQRVRAIQRLDAARMHRELVAKCERGGHLTSDELLSCADGLLGLAEQSEADAKVRRNPTQREIPLSAAKVYREIAGKCQRMAGR